MKTAVRKSSIPESNAFLVKHLDAPYFDPNWHFHKEYQLFVVLEGRGTRFIGDSIKSFTAGDMVFSGPNLPHLWRSDDVYFEKNKNLRSRGIVVYFSQYFLGDSLLEKEEMNLVKNLFEKASLGIEIFGDANKVLQKKLEELITLKGLESLIKLLEILHVLATTTQFNYIANHGYINTHKESDKTRMNIVHEHVMKNFKQKISLEEVASLAFMTPSSFSRYFKTRANKPFSTFVSEIRTGHACKLLLEDKMNVAQICYECGFRTLSNFNKQFKEVMKTSPLKYKKEYLKVL